MHYAYTMYIVHMAKIVVHTQFLREVHRVERVVHAHFSSAFNSTPWDSSENMLNIGDRPTLYGFDPISLFFDFLNKRVEGGNSWWVVGV